MITKRFTLEENFNFLIDSNIDLSGSFERPVLGGSLSFNNGFINLNSAIKIIKKKNLTPKEDEKVGQNSIGIMKRILK